MFNSAQLSGHSYPQCPQAIFLDRDGVVNHDSEFYIKSLAEWHPIPGSIEAIVQLSQAQIKVIIVTNQSGLARGLFTAATLVEIHTMLIHAVTELQGKVTDIFYCPHGPEHQCECRKPKPGLIFAAAQKYHLDLSACWFVGDSWRDLEAARSAHVQPALVLTGKGQNTLSTHPELLEQIPIFDDLAGFANWLIGGK